MGDLMTADARKDEMARFRIRASRMLQKEEFFGRRMRKEREKGKVSKRDRKSARAGESE